MKKAQLTDAEYLKILDWFWSTVPYLHGYKHTYGIFFLAVLDCIRNSGFERVTVSYEFVTNKARVTKVTYLDARLWLMEQGLLRVEAGTNNYQPAAFRIGVKLSAIISKPQTA